ncbi:MAG: TetR/AcrR family transcriptional regulator [Candidatus Omnitrophica bacterium]|nr:TetR/AcrR family transcriptional regulator [Candidatus Omnitrophota bacterium]MCM8802443.1 TetR/AcrR family transcriptional regulator [Candidatus Omnitrophota bacterium]
MENKKNLIIKVAERLISKKGYSKTTVDEITKKAGIGKGTFYLYFKDKNDLFFSIIKQEFENLMLKIKDDVSDIDDFFERLKKGIEIYLSYFEKNYNFFRILLQEKPFIRRKSFEQFWKDFFKRWGSFMKEGFDKQIKENKIKKLNLDDIIYSLIGILHGNIHKWLIDGRSYSLIKKKDVIFKIFTEGIKR